MSVFRVWSDRVWTGQFPDGSELLVSSWLDDDDREVMEAAVRPPGERCWGPPIYLVEEHG